MINNSVAVGAWIRSGCVGLAGAAAAVMLCAAAPVYNEKVVVPALPMGTPSRTVTVAAFRSRIAASESVGWIKPVYEICIGSNVAQYLDGKKLEDIEAGLLDNFYREVEAAGYKPGNGSKGMFGEALSPGGDTVVGISLEAMHFEMCDRGEFHTLKGWASAGLEWQIFSKSEGRVIAKLRTDGAFKVDNGVEQGSVILAGAYAINIRKFLASQEFRNAFAGTEPSPPETASTAVSPRPALGAKSPVYYSNKSNGPTTIGDSVGGVVTIVAPDNSWGSGFLIGSEGLFLTNHHVVGTNRFLKIRWPDGLEMLGEVLRSDPKRDVALIKSDPRGRAPLKLSIGPLSPGEEVYAIGTPFDPGLQNTVTKGVVSATNRVMEGYSFIQSDVAVTHGNSGGPLLDKSANVIGMTDIGIAPNDVPLSLNLFIPIRDALEFLTLQPTPAAPAATAVGAAPKPPA